jgi:hypothetical protein
MPYLWSGGIMTAVETGQLGATRNGGQIPAEGLFAALNHRGPETGP